MFKKSKKSARLLVVSNNNPLSSQLKKLTGDTYSDSSFDTKEKGDVLKHKKSGKWFIVISNSELQNLTKQAYDDLMSYYRRTYNLSSIRKK